MEGWLSNHQFSRIQGEHLLEDAGVEAGKSAVSFHGLSVQRDMVPYIIKLKYSTGNFAGNKYALPDGPFSGDSSDI